MNRDTVVNWWDYYAFGKDLILPGIKNTTSANCVNGTNTCIDVTRREEHAQS